VWGFINCTRYFLAFGAPKVVLHDATLIVGTSEKVGLLVPSGEGKSTIIRMLAGVEEPDSGLVLRDEGGWPLGYSGAFRPELTGEENVRKLATIVGLDPTAYSAFCAGFSELGDAYFHPLRFYSARMRARLAFSTSLGVPATTYLADDKLSAGDDRFRKKCEAALLERLRTAGLIFVASNPNATREVCDRHGVVSRGKIILCETHDEAKQLFQSNFDGSTAEEIADEELPSFDLA
jgi:capsular polysaccharide transport system ATP-binding protein